MAKRSHQAAVVLAVMCLALGAGAARSDSGSVARATSAPVHLEAATMIVEVNATDGDAGLQVFLDGDPWRSMKIFDPRGRAVVAIEARGRLKDFGLTELFSESSEPPFDRFPLEQFKALWPEGSYRFVGETVEGERVVGRARLSHDIPAGPVIAAPADGAVVAPGAVVVRWDPVAEPPGIQVVGYRAIVERERPLRTFSADLPASATSVTIPAEFLEPGTEYKLEVQAIEASGNQTLTEISFDVS
jgi:hypothetical protein